jgi:hypothetical protein
MFVESQLFEELSKAERAHTHRFKHYCKSAQWSCRGDVLFFAIGMTPFLQRLVSRDRSDTVLDV